MRPSARMVFLWVLTSLGAEVGARIAKEGNPHQVYTLTWQIYSQSGEVVWEVQGNHALNTWWPPLTPDFCQLAAGLDTWDIPDRSPKNLETSMEGTSQQLTPQGCSKPWKRCALAERDFYVCPRDNRNRATAHRCGGYEEYFCSAWGCETTGDAYWRPTSSWDLITITRNYTKPDSCDDRVERKRKMSRHWRDPLSLPLKITFTDSGKRALGWQTGYTWGLRWYLPGKDRGIILKIKLKIDTITQTVGPNLVLADQKAPVQLAIPAQPPRAPTQTPRVNPVNSTPSPSLGYPAPAPGPRPPYPTSPSRPGTGDRLLNLVQGVYLTLNLTTPNQTQDCWLCLTAKPPYYQGVAIIGNFTNHTNAPLRCSTTPRHGLTLTEVTGHGLCIGKIPPSHQNLCSQTIPSVGQGPYYLTAPNGTYWVCNTGLTPCISLQILNDTADYCILIELWPKIFYHDSEYIYGHYELGGRFRRDPVSLTVALLLGGLTMGSLAAGIGTGTAALIETNQFKQLQIAMHSDIQALEESISALERSLTSLSEVVLQNRRGLDLLFLQEGGLCAALKEECCFYADHTGIVRDSMAKLRERLKQRQKLFESQQGWFEGWYNKSPWFTTLVSSLMGPLILLLLILVFGPCILNRLVQFIRERLSVIQALVLTQQYHQLRQFDAERPDTIE
uniref:Envelope polyprotein n=1 Tax=Felis catus TaxID=9685 RepID=I7HEG6_FELCA|nr:envelope polyprotein [Felis catus]BAM33602.1 envelope polyprotein [Felis catus]